MLLPATREQRAREERERAGDDDDDNDGSLCTDACLLLPGARAQQQSGCRSKRMTDMAVSVKENRPDTQTEWCVCESMNTTADLHPHAVSCMQLCYCSCWCWECISMQTTASSAIVYLCLCGGACRAQI